jgi:hypothetical protein
MAGITFSTPIRAVLRIPKRSLLIWFAALGQLSLEILMTFAVHAVNLPKP